MDEHCDPPPNEAAVWLLCLAIVRCRRSGNWPSEAGRYACEGAGHAARLVATTAADAPLAWSAADGWSLHGEPDARTLGFFALYKPLLDRPPDVAPFVIAQLGQSLDGFVATHRGHSSFVTGPQSLVHLHRLRALCDAVIVGAGTVAADNPRLTTRHVDGEHPVRVVLDTGRELNGGARVFRDRAAPTLRLCPAETAVPMAPSACAPTDAGATRPARTAWAAASDAQTLPVPGLLRADGALDAAAVVAALHARGLDLLFVEGGGVTVSRFLAQGCLDRLHLTIAPVLIGAGRPGLQVAAADTMGDCLRLACRTVQLGDDVLWDIDLRGRAAGSVTATP